MPVEPIIIPIRWRDLDALGHVNNAVFLSYLEMARFGYFARLTTGFEIKPPMVVARIEIDYLAPLLLTDGTVEIHPRTTRFGKKSFTMDYALQSNGRRVAQAVSILVWIDETGISTHIPTWFREAIEAVEGPIPGGSAPLVP